MHYIRYEIQFLQNLYIICRLCGLQVVA